MQIEITPEYLAAQGLNEKFPKRFWKKVHKTPTCWLWTACKRGDYGGIAKGIKENGMISAHVASWILHYGPVPNGLCVCHHCDVRHCVNPKHLFLGTHADNSRDMVQKGRSQRGERNGFSKLTEEDVKAIRASYIPRKVSTYALGKKYGVYHTCIWKIIVGESWGHITSQHTAD